MSKQIHFGLIGAGRIGRVHAETLTFRLPEAKILAVTDIDSEAAQALAAHCGIPTVTDSADEILANPAIDAVLICSPTGTHAELIVKAAEAGKHIFCEKPLPLILARSMRARRGRGRRRSTADWIQPALRRKLRPCAPRG